MSEWISVKDRLPEENGYVLAYSSSDDLVIIVLKSKFQSFEITHWMPLPEPPEEESE